MIYYTQSKGVIMSMIKKSINIDETIAKDIDQIIKDNPEMTFTTITIQALKNWIENPVIKIARPRQVTDSDLKNMIEEDKELLMDLAK